ncbi:MAG: glycoside hydrolase family 2 TIM barrel-domain containing protein [Lachnospiraceae bacterium]
MKQIMFNDNWKVTRFRSKKVVDFLKKPEENDIKITLPYDAMIEEATVSNCKSGGQTGFYPGGFYTYLKKFMVPKEWEGKEIFFEFEGVYQDAQIFINGDYAGGHANGYGGFYIKAHELFKYDEENEIEVQVNNSSELNSRWYSGSGIYRNVSLWIGEEVFIPLNGVRITTPTIDKKYAMINIDTKIKERENRKHNIALYTQILDKDNKSIAEEKTEITVYPCEEENIRQRIGIHNPVLWSCENPYLYHCVITLQKEEEVLETLIEQIGVRRIELDSTYGFRLNGETVKLRGACIHHDNGVIGANALAKAEYRKCRQLKEAGFNCLRSAHNPISKAMLEACDGLGMLVMDELTDIWNRRKNQNDIAPSFASSWQDEVESMIYKDFNHPSVILYCMGNEISEVGTERGAWLNRKIANKIRSIDDTRFVTNAINGNMAIMDKLMQVLEEITAKRGTTVAEIIAGKGKDDNGGGSNGLNALMAIFLGEMGDDIVTHPIMTKRIREFVDAMDIAGYNYMTGRHEVEGKQFPNRVVLGTETFPSEIVKLWDIVKRNNHVIGDMTWTGYDYLGEAGIGISYYDGTNNFAASYPDKVAYCGDIDLIGRRRCISYLRETVFGLSKEPYIAVERLDRYAQTVSRTPWNWKDNIASWTWHGFEGKPAKLDVITDAQEVELFLNGESLGRKAAGEKNGYVASYEITYQPGELKAVNYRHGIEAETKCLYTASTVTELNIHIEGEKLKADGADLSFITIGLLDKEGKENMFETKDITIQVEGDGYLQGFGSADPRCGKSFQDTTWETYDGYVMAVVRAGTESGEIKVQISAPKCETKKVILTTYK